MSRIVAASIVVLGAVGCSAPRSASPYQPPAEIDRRPARAAELNRSAADLIASDPVRAEELLREALAADLFHGPSHNNLGLILLARGELFEAAAEFEWARKLLPEHPDPRMNLAIVLERAGRLEEAIAMYSGVLEAAPEHIPSIQALACLQVRSGRRDARTPELLREIAMRGLTESWRSWARMQVAASQ